MTDEIIVCLSHQYSVLRLWEESVVCLFSANAECILHGLKPFEMQSHLYLSLPALCGWRTNQPDKRVSEYLAWELRDMNDVELLCSAVQYHEPLFTICVVLLRHINSHIMSIDFRAGAAPRSYLMRRCGRRQVRVRAWFSLSPYGHRSTPIVRAVLELVFVRWRCFQNLYPYM